MRWIIERCDGQRRIHMYVPKCIEPSVRWRKLEQHDSHIGDRRIILQLQADIWTFFQLTMHRSITKTFNYAHKCILWMICFSHSPGIIWPLLPGISSQNQVLNTLSSLFSKAMVQNSSTCTPVSFSLPNILVNWPYEPLLHSDYGSVDLESANWVNDSHLFNPKAQLSFDKSLFGPQSAW